MAAGQIRTSENHVMALDGPGFCQRMCLDFFSSLFSFFMLWKRFIFSYVYFLLQVYIMYPCYLFLAKVLSVFIMCLLLLLCCILRSPDGNVAGVCPVQPRLGCWWSQLLPAWERWPWDGRGSSTEQEPQLWSAKVMHDWNTLVKLKLVLIPSVGNTVNENRSNQMKIIYFISLLEHCKTSQGSIALWCKPEIDEVPLFTSKTTKVKTFKRIKAILLIVSTEDSPLPFLAKYS